MPDVQPGPTACTRTVACTVGRPARAGRGPHHGRATGAMPRRRACLSHSREPKARLSRPSSVFFRAGTTERGASVSVTARCWPRDGCDEPGRRHRRADLGVFQAQLRPSRVRLAASPAFRAGPKHRQRDRPGPGLHDTPLASRARTIRRRSPESGAAGRARGKGPLGSAREVPSGAPRADVRVVASVLGQLRVITDTDAPRSVVAAVEKTEEGRLRSPFGSREWLRPGAGAASRQVLVRGAGRAGGNRCGFAWIPRRYLGRAGTPWGGAPFHTTRFVNSRH